ncbi:MAG: hypothetical protein V3R51_01435 [Gammaproteobacteria bacterium]
MELKRREEYPSLNLATLGLLHYPVSLRQSGLRHPWRSRVTGRPFTGRSPISVSPMVTRESEASRSTFLRFAILLRSKARGPPSMADPFAGTKVHWTFVLFRLTPVTLAAYDALGYSSPFSSTWALITNYE